MTITIGNIKINYLSGPDKIGLITPNSIELFKKWNVNEKMSYLPPILVIGDIHNSTSDNCASVSKCYDNDLTCMNIFSPLFYKALDSLSSENSRIDIFLETGFFPYLLKDANIFNELRDKNLFITNDSLLSYIPRYYPSCFSSKEIGCITTNLRYHLADIRFNPSNFNYLDHENEVIFLSIALMKDPKFIDWPLEQIYDFSTSYIESGIEKIDNEIKNKFKNIKFNLPDETIDLSRWLNISKKGNKPSKNPNMNKPPHFATFESYLFFCVENCFNYLNSISCDFFETPGKELIKNICEDPESFILFLLQHPQFKTKSIIYNKIKQSYMGEEICLKLVKRYFIYYQNKFVKPQIKSNNYKYILEQAINDYEKELNNYMLFLNRPLHRNINNGNNKEDFGTNLIQVYPQMCQNFADFISAPLMDLYFLISSWNNMYRDSICCVYIAGTNHIETLTNFLVFEEKCFDISFFHNKKAIINRKSLNQTIDENQKLSLSQKNNVTKTLLRCIDLTNEYDSYNFEEELKKYWLELINKNVGKIFQYKYTLLLNKIYLNNERLKYLTYKYYVKLLSGHLISEKEIEELYLYFISMNKGKEISKKKFIQKCNLLEKFI